MLDYIIRQSLSKTILRFSTVSMNSVSSAFWNEDFCLQISKYKNTNPVSTYLAIWLSLASEQTYIEMSCYPHTFSYSLHRCILFNFYICIQKEHMCQNFCYKIFCVLHVLGQWQEVEENNCFSALILSWVRHWTNIPYLFQTSSLIILNYFNIIVYYNIMIVMHAFCVLALSTETGVPMQ